MISSLLTFLFKAFLFIFRAIRLVYHLASATSLGFLFCVGIVIFVLSRYFRLKQPNLPANLSDAIGGNQHIDSRQCSTGQEQQQQLRCNSSDTIEWWPIANKAACLDSVENSRTAIEKVSRRILDLALSISFSLSLSHTSRERRKCVYSMSFWNDDSKRC